MLDKIVARYGIRKQDTQDPNYLPGDAIVDMRLLNPDSQKLTVLFPPWHGAGKAITALERRLIRAGSAVLSIDFHGQILESNQANVLDSFRHAQAVTTAKLEELESRQNYSQIDFIGMSVGTVSMALVAQSYRKFSKATFVVGADRIAPVLWNGTRTEEIRKDFEKQGMTLTELQRCWQEIDPVLSIPLMKDKTVSMVISTTDTFVPTENQIAFANEMQLHVDELTIKKSRLGHAASIAAFCLNGEL